MAGRITIDNLSDSLKEVIEQSGLTEEQVIQLIESNISGDLDLLNTTDKSSLVAAINELFQNANNGKELIANVIGEPLDSNDTFSAMSNDINSLLSTFKTNMMNNGITVESGDKFKSLIDKIATMVEEGEGKGIQYASGICTQSSYSSGEYDYGATYTFNIQTNLTFVPDIIFVRMGYNNVGSTSNVSNKSNLYISNLMEFNEEYTAYSDINKISINNITKEGFQINVTTSRDSIGLFNDWYAIGVGEEDTTLRDSLASILENKGVDVTEEDDMASLITKVDNAFDNLIPKKTYLYNRGTEYTTITLGTGNGVQRKETDHLYIDGAYFNGALTSGRMSISYTYNKGDENKYLYLDLNSTGGNLVIGNAYYGDGVSYTLGGRGLLRLDLSEAPSFTSFVINSTDDVRIYEMYISNM